MHFYSELSISRKEVPISEIKMEVSLHQRPKSTVREYYEQFCAHKFHSLDENEQTYQKMHTTKVQ